MSKLILEVERIEDYIRRGYPEGVEPVIKSVPVLLKRIEELERALMPFARVGSQPTPNTQGDMSLVYHSDCRVAFDKLSKKAAQIAEAARVALNPQYEYPAE